MKQERYFLNKEELARIKTATENAEKNTSGEIRVKIISRCREGFDPDKEAPPLIKTRPGGGGGGGKDVGGC